jgi:hypothetical protein
MCTAQSSSLGGNKLVPSRTFCSRAVARGLAELKNERERSWTLQVFLDFPFVVRGHTLTSDFEETTWILGRRPVRRARSTGPAA